MIDTIRHDLRYVAAAMAIAAVVGASAWISPAMPVLLVAAAGILAAGLLRPVVLVPIVFAGILWSNAGLFEPVQLGVNITLGKLSMAAALGIWSVHAALNERPLLTSTPLTAPLLVVLAVMVASLTWAEWIRYEFGVNEIIGYAMLLVMFHWVTTVVDEESLPVVLRAIGWIVVPVMAWTLWSTPSMEWWEEYERAEGVYDNANFWCAILLLVCPMLVAFFAEDDHWTSPWLLAALATLLPLNIVASLSRAGFIGLVAILPFLAWLLWRRKWWVLVGTALVIGLVPSFADPERVLLRYQSLVDPSLQEIDGSLTDRGIAARAAIQVFLEHPLHGVGVGMFMPAALQSTSGAMTLAEPHNTYAGIAAEQGLLGLVTHGWLFARIGGVAWTALRRSGGGLHRSLAVGLVASLVAIATMGVTASFMTFPMLYLVLGLGVVLWRATARAASDAGEAPEVGPAPAA